MSAITEVRADVAKMRRKLRSVTVEHEAQASCQTAGPRIPPPNRAWTPPPGLVTRAGAFDYLSIPSRVGNARLTHHAASNMEQARRRSGTSSTK